MPNAIIVLNLNNYLIPHARRSMLAATRRWGCSFLEVRQKLKNVGMFWQKPLIAVGPAQAYDRVLALDGDILIRDDCQSLFAMVPEDGLGVVSRCQHGCNTGDAGMARWSRILGLPQPPDDRHMNGGLFLYNPRLHRPLLEKWVAAGASTGWRHNRTCDQASLSVLLYNTTFPVVWLPWEYNAVYAGRTGSQHTPPGDMQTPIYHFNANRGKRAAIRATRWSGYAKSTEET